jgi:GntR family histidine utilization transcriptional repressor
MSIATPLYEQVKKRILGRIAAGSLEAGDRVPSENELVRALHISRMTAHRALSELTRDGILVRQAGVGTFVADQRAHGHPLQIRNIAADIRSRGHAHQATVVTLRKQVASAELARAFDIAVHAPLFHSRIVHREEGVPIQLDCRWVNPLLAPKYLEQDFTRQTPYEYLTRVAPLQEVEHTVQAVTAEARVRKLLAMAAHEPCLLIRRRTWTANKVASVAQLYHPGSRFDLTGRFRP